MTTDSPKNLRRIHVERLGTAALAEAVERALRGAGILDRLTPGCRVALKPNFTYPQFKPGVTTSPAVLREVARAFRRRTPHIAVVETDGGYGAWDVEDAFRGHDVYRMETDLGIVVVNLMREPAEAIPVVSLGRKERILLPKRLLYDTDLFVTIPVPKIHAMTLLTAAYKNQWGCIPDTMRLRRHAVFDEAIVAINDRLRPAVLVDGQWFLDRNGPMEGDPVRMDLIIGASDAGTCDRYLADLMRIPWQRVSHLPRAVARGSAPRTLADVAMNVRPRDVSSRTFRLRRTVRNWIALTGFRSRFITWFGYESWVGRVILHGLLYAIVGRPEFPERPGANGTRTLHP